MENIVIQDVNYSRKNKTIIENLSLTINEGDCFAILGENGSGKSTIIDIITTEIKVDSGFVTLFGSATFDPDKIAVCYDNSPTFSELKVCEFLKYFCCIYKLNYDKIRDEYFELFNLNTIEKTVIRSLSLGEKKKISILISIMNKPKLLILDEPFSNIDPTFIDKIWRKLIIDCKTVLFTTHNWTDVLNKASKVCFIYRGKQITEPMSPKDLISTLPSNKVLVCDLTNETKLITEKYESYIHDYQIFSFIKENDVLINDIISKTNNFSVKNADLQDVYLFNIKNI